MFDFDVSKMMIVGVLALIVLGPKELPRVMRQLGLAIGKMRRMANEFQGQFMDAMREAELDDIRKEVAKISDSAKIDLPSVDPAAELRKAAEGAPAAAPASAPVSSAATAAASVVSDPPFDITPPEPAPAATSETLAAEIAREQPTRYAPAVTTPTAGKHVELGEEISFRKTPSDDAPASPEAPRRRSARPAGA
jgi:sec-independent protein translocase protein TatB